MNGTEVKGFTLFGVLVLIILHHFHFHFHFHFYSCTINKLPDVESVCLSAGRMGSLGHESVFAGGWLVCVRVLNSEEC